jgi:cytochrome c peroxidase
MGPLPRATHLVTGPVVLSLALLSVAPPTGARAPERLAARPAERPHAATPPSSELPEDTLERPLPLAIPAGLEVAFEKAGWEEAAAGSPLGLDADLVALGRALFFDPVLSRDGSVACASCHRPEASFADPRPRSVGVDGETTRNAPALVNRILGGSFMWDGRAATLEDQVLMPLANPVEMDLPADRAAARLAEDPAWTARFETACGGPPTRDRLARALAAFVRALVQGDSPVDRFLAGEVAALTAEEEAGMWVFESRGKCWRCHNGANFSDERLHSTGVGAREGAPEEGRFAVTGEERDRGRFKTPTLRGLAHSAPYMHDGSLATLEEVVEFYRRGGEPHGTRSPLMEPLELTDADARNLVAFLRALTPR